MLVKWGLIRFYEAPWGACKKEFTYLVIALVVEFWVGFKNSLRRDTYLVLIKLKVGEKPIFANVYRFKNTYSK